MKKDHLSPDQFDKLSIDDFGNRYGRDGELAVDQEGLELAIAAGYSPLPSLSHSSVFQLFFRDAKPTRPRTNWPWLAEGIRQTKA
jgi:hypothetical protein